MSSELASNYSAYSDSGSDDDTHTEFEAIKLIQEQVIQIQSLKAQLTQLHQYQQTIQIQATQITSQATQIQNLKQQINIFEERFSSMEQFQENTSQNISIDYERQVQVLKGQLGVAETYLKQETKKHHDLCDQLVCQRQELEIRDRMTHQVRQQVIQVQDELKQATAAMQSRNQELSMSLSKTKNAKKLLSKEIKALAEQNQKQAQTINEKNGEITQLIQRINEKEIQIRKSKLEVDKAKYGREFVETRVPQMEQQVAELNLVVEKMTREADKEARRRLEAIKDRDSIQNKYTKLHEVFQALEIEDPEQFKSEFDLLKKDIVKLRKQLSEKTKVVTAKEVQLKQKEDELKTDAEIIVISLEKLTQWATDQLNYANLSKDVQLEWVLDPICEQLFQKLKQCQKGLASKFQKVRTKQADHEHEILEHKRLQGEIMNDFKRLQTQISTQKQEHAMLDQEVSDSRAMLKRQHHEKEEYQVELNAQKKFLVECFNQCMNIRHRFLQNHLISDQVDLNLKQDFNVDQHIAVLELISMIGNITNSLNFEIKNADLKNTQIRELEQMVENEKLRFDLKLAQYNSEAEKAQIKRQQTIDESVNAHQLTKADLHEKCKEIQMLNTQLNQLRKEYAAKDEHLKRSKEEVRSVRKCLPGILLKLMELSSQKQSLGQMLTAQLKISAAIKSRIGGFTKAPDNQEHLSYRYEQSVFKFRRCVIAVVAINRMKKSAVVDATPLNKIISKLNLPKNTASVVSDHLIGTTDIKKMKHNRFDSVISMLALGLNNIIEVVSKSNHLASNLKSIIMPNRVSFDPVFDTVNQQKDLIHRLEQDNEDILRASEAVESKHVNLQNTHKDLLLNFTHFQQNQEQLRQELQESVPKNEYERLKEAWGSISDEVAHMRRQITNATQQLQQQMGKMDELEADKRAFFERALVSEQKLGDKERDLELKDIKIESLENIIKKRGIQEQPPPLDQKGVRELQKTIGHLEEKLAKAIRAKEKLEQKIDKIEQHHVSKIQDQSNKQGEIQKLLETNIQTLESRCELLQMQNESYKRDREEANKPNNLHLLSVTSPTFQGLEQQSNRRIDEPQHRYQLTNDKRHQQQAQLQSQHSQDAQYIFSSRHWQATIPEVDIDNIHMANHSFQMIGDQLNNYHPSDRKSSELSGGLDTMVFGTRALNGRTSSVASSQQAFHVETSVPGKISRSSSLKKV